MKFAIQTAAPSLYATLPAPHVAATFLAALLAGFMAGCGGKVITTYSRGTTVTLFITSKANDRLASYYVGLTQLSLIARDGTTANLLSSPILPEFIHVNGTLEPYLTVSVPQGEYTSASASSSGGEAMCYALDSNKIAVDNITFGSLVPAGVTVTLPSPITVSGASMALVLDSLVSESVGLSSGCSKTGTLLLTPTFELIPITRPGGQPTNTDNGKALRLQGMITSIDANSGKFDLARMYDQPVGQVVTWHVTSTAITVYQGVSRSSQLAVGMPVDMDASVQNDGSLLATRVEVYDADTSNLTVVDGPLLGRDATLDWSGGVETEHLLLLGDNISQGSVPGNLIYWDAESAAFLISGELGNIDKLPFRARFDRPSMAAGQHVVATTHDSMHDVYTVNGYASAATITLIPQTINGTITAIGSESGFTTYTIALAPYDLFPQLAAQVDRASVLIAPTTVVVYADSNAQKLSTIRIAVGSFARFYGLVFNDNGALRMDCAQISDGLDD